MDLTSFRALEFLLHFLHELGFRERFRRCRGEAPYLLIRHKCREIDPWETLHQEGFDLFESLRFLRKSSFFEDADDVCSPGGIPFYREEAAIDAHLGGCSDAPTADGGRVRKIETIEEEDRVRPE